MGTYSVVALLLVASSVASAFTPPSRVCTSRTSKLFRSSKHGAVATDLNMVSVPNPFEKLPWNVQRDNDRKKRHLRRECAKLYRELGIAEDASFEEITEATSNMKLKYDGDLKKQIKIDVIKDKIMQLRLEQRMGGLVGETKEARADTYLNKEAVKYKQAQAAEWEPPKFLQGLVVKPNEAWRDNMIITFGGLSAAGIFIPNMAKSFTFLSLIVASGFMGQRGTHDFDPDMPRGRIRAKVGVHNLIAFMLCLPTWLLTWAIVLFTTSQIPALVGNKIEQSLHNIVVCAVMGFITAFLQPYKKK